MIVTVIWQHMFHVFFNFIMHDYAYNFQSQLRLQLEAFVKLFEALDDALTELFKQISIPPPFLLNLFDLS